MGWDIDSILNSLTLEEKAGLCSGRDFWNTKGVERLGIPSVMVTDGPHGLRKQAQAADHLGLNESVPAVCFPSGAALASSFDRELIGKLGRLLGEEARSEQVHTLLGPAINMKRSPLCGRNFEYLSEDPYLAGEMSASYVTAVQEQGVGVSVKHFAANNQENRRMSVSAQVDERTLREIYLTAFEKTVKQANPWTLMCSYNQINGVYSCENPWLLTKVLRDEWGFDGIVMTDWGAMNRRCDALEAGLELEMPSSNGQNDALLVQAVKNGTLSEETLDKGVRRLLQWLERGLSKTGAPTPYDKEAHHAMAREIAAQCAVLLKNDGILPLRQGAELAVIGGFAGKPRFQGGGSSHINAFRLTSALEALDEQGIPYTYAKGFEADGDDADEALMAQAVQAAAKAKVAVVFAGLPDSYESEGYDRTHLNLPPCQDQLISRIAAVQPNLVVVLHNGSPVLMPWLSDVNAVLELYLAGQASGQAAVDLLFGKANPSGKLAETFPLRLQDTPSYLNFPGTNSEVNYAEGLYIGYRYYDAKEMDVLFPFGYGLSYTTFALSDLRLSAPTMKDTGSLTATVKVKNTGNMAGSEVVQLYIAPPASAKVLRPLRELKGFAKVALAPGEEKEVSFLLDKRSFAYYDTGLGDWHAPGGTYEILAGSSSRDLPLAARVELECTLRQPLVYKDTTTIGDLLDGDVDPVLLQSILNQLGALFQGGGDGQSQDDALGMGAEGLRKMMEGMPVHSLVSFGGMTRQQLDQIITMIKG